MKIVIATDAWFPQTNGVVTTLNHTAECLRDMGHEVFFITPESFKTIAMPTYKEIRLALFPARGVRRDLDRIRPDAIHIATEGPIGLAVRSYCRKHKFPFTSSYHTQFPEYMRMRFPVPLWFSYLYFKWFHAASVRTLVATHSQRKRLQKRSFERVVIWSRGVDTHLFRPCRDAFLVGERPLFIYVGRVSVEKNLADFLDLELPGTKYVVGEGPAYNEYKSCYDDVVFTGYQYGEDLARLLSAADVFVFPSKTDTFGLVMLEAMASGLPVAAYPVTGPVDVVTEGVTGVLNDDLKVAALSALELNGGDAREYALEHSWKASTEVFLQHLQPMPSRQL